MVVVIALAVPAWALDLTSTLELSGFLGADVRVFPNDAAFPGQEQNVLSPSLLGQPELRWVPEDVDGQLTFVPFGRWDSDDPERTHFDLRELNWLQIGDTWDLRAGVGKVYWGVAESRHLVDVVNQVDAVEDVDEEDRLGQPMVAFTWLLDRGSIGLFYLPYFRERTFPGRRGRLRFPVVVDTDRPEYDTDLDEWYPTFAGRIALTFGAFDVGLAHLYGIGREPRLRLELPAPPPGMPPPGSEPFPDGTPSPEVLAAARLIPLYDRTHQTSLDAQWTRGAWLWKLEVITRSGQADRFAALVGGFEHTFFDLLATGADLGVLAEYLWDGRDRDFDEAPPTAFENDVFGGLRLALNDVQSTSILAGAVVDVGSGAAFASIEASRRFFERWTAELELRILGNAPTDDVLDLLEQDDYFQLRVARYF